LTLPALIFLGLPPGIANGTNRVGILTQNIAAVWRFDRGGVLDRRAMVWAALPATLGAALGTWGALQISDHEFQRLLALLMVLFAIVSLWSPQPRGSAREGSPVRGLGLGLGFFLVGVYAGFVQAGVGFLILAVTTMIGLDLVRGNAVKVLAILCATALSLAIFAWQGRVAWPLGLALAGGQALGGALGARLTITRGHGFVRAVVLVAVVVFAVKLWLDS
jgi:uncharacterized membrane protein YfcA